MSAYSEFFLRSASSVVQLECIEISHPSFTKVYRIVRNATKGVSVRYENGVFYSHDYYPLKLTSLGSRGDLDQGFRINLGDLGEILPKELDAISVADTYRIKPVVKYRAFRSDDLSNAMFGPLVLEAGLLSFKREGCTFDAKAPSLNINKTGELYKLDRFPGLRGFL